jgi:predicted enzyme related to lactoylglutathione lyase
MDKNANALNWFEIPATDISRATKFYETIFEMKMNPLNTDQFKMSMFPIEPMAGKVGGALMQSGMHKPSSTGALVYLNANPDLQIVLSRVEKAGGKVLMPKTQISPEYGHMACFTDTEGNNVALHSNK